MEQGSSKIMSKLRQLLPEYSWLPVAAVVICNFAVYYITNIAVPESSRHYIDMPVDRALPVIPFFVVFYVLCYLQWAVNWLMTGRESRSVCFRFAKADITAKLICLVCFIVYPTIIQRPSIEVTDFFTWGLNFIYSADKPINCLPSIHVIASWIAMRAAFKLKKPGNAYRVVMVVITLLCMLSVVFTKQHYVIDIPAGIIAAEAGLAISKILSDEKFLWVC